MKTNEEATPKTVTNEEIAQALANSFAEVFSPDWQRVLVVLAGQIQHALEAKDREHDRITTKMEADFLDKILAPPFYGGYGVCPTHGRVQCEECKLPPEPPQQIPDMREKCHDFENTAQGMFCVSCGTSWLDYEALGRPFCDGPEKPAPQAELERCPCHGWPVGRCEWKPEPNVIAAREVREKCNSLTAEQRAKLMKEGMALIHGEPSSESKERARGIAAILRGLNANPHTIDHVEKLIATAIEEARRDGVQSAAMDCQEMQEWIAEVQTYKAEKEKAEAERDRAIAERDHVARQKGELAQEESNKRGELIAKLAKSEAERDRLRAEFEAFKVPCGGLTATQRFEQLSEIRKQLLRSDHNMGLACTVEYARVVVDELLRLRAELSDERATRTHIGQCLSQLQAEHGDLQEACGRLRADLAATQERLRVAHDHLAMHYSETCSACAKVKQLLVELRLISAPTTAEGEAR